MCGIAGILDASNQTASLPDRIARMRDRLRHRGPDDEGTYVSEDSRCALAHTRLSILDLSPAGHQPMGMREQGAGSREQKRYWITYNGEIYNFKELREELGRRGEALGVRREEQRAEDSQTPEIENQRSDVRNQRSENQTQETQNASAWSSNSDTEVILRAYAKWGRECANHLRGMFAFAIWDNQKEELILARDPFGIKPLYYFHTDEVFLFASEVRALLASGLVPRKVSQDGLTSYLEVGSVQDPLTIIDGVQSLLPGHSLTAKRNNKLIETDQCSFSHVFAPNPSRLTPNGTTTSRVEAIIQLRQILEESVRAHLVSDVPVGAFLSGGIDSSAIVALMTKVAEQTPKTFSVIFSESEFSEAEHAQLVAKTFGTEHQEILLSEDHLLNMLPNALEAMDQPTMDGINTYVVSKAVKDAGVTVALSGLGGDELFAGYPSFRRAAQLHRLAITPSAIRQLASRAGRAVLNGSARRRKFWDMFESDCSPYAAYAISRQLFSSAEIASLLTRGQKSEARGHSAEDRDQRSEISGESNESGKFEIRNPKSEIEVPPHGDVVNAVSRYELTGYMVNTLLRDTDQMSMAHALEVRVPFIDSAVVSFVLGLPGEWKLNGSRPKPLLLDALGDLLPEEIWRRRKMGFTLPFQKWMRSALQPELDKTLSSENGTARFGINADHMRHTWSAFKKNSTQEPWSRPWALYVLAKWCELNEVTADGL